MHKRSYQRGTSLVELVVVLAILGILASVTFYRIAPATAASEDEGLPWAQWERVACHMNLRIAQNATEYYGVLEGGYPLSPAELYPSYLDRVPRCPVSGEPYYYDEYHIIHCAGHPR